MDDKKKEQEKSEDKEEAGAKEESTPSSDVGKPSDQEEAIVTKAKEAADTQKEAEELKSSNLAREEKLMERKEALAKLGGGSPAGDRPETPAKQTDTEYAEALQRGEVNPLKEDGFLK